MEGTNAVLTLFIDSDFITFSGKHSDKMKFGTV